MKIVFLFLFWTNVYSAEVDNFTGRFKSNLKDSTKLFNKNTNAYFKKGLRNANFGLLKCNDRKLYFHLKKYFNSTFFGEIVRWVNETKTLDKHAVTITPKH